MTLTSDQTCLHSETVALCRLHRKVEAKLICSLQEIDRLKLYKHFNQPSLFLYAVKEFSLSEPIAYAFIAVARKARDLPPLQTPIGARRISVSKATRIVSCLTADNAQDVIEFAIAYTCREIDFECARRNPKRPKRDRIRPIGADSVEISFTASCSLLEKIQRVQSLEARRGAAQAGLAPAIEAALDAYLKHRDPVRKAERAEARKGGLCTHKVVRVEPVVQSKARAPLTAAQKHAVFARDGGKCTHVGTSGERCKSDRWIDVHHVRPVSRDGGNEPGNLVLLCSYHHELVHQMSLPIEGQVSWLRSREVVYEA